MNEYKITLQDGDYFYTRMNATSEEAKAYYLGNVFNMGRIRDDMQKVVSVEQI